MSERHITSIIMPDGATVIRNNCIGCNIHIKIIIIMCNTADMF
jgi:hypothetical protein